MKIETAQDAKPFASTLSLPFTVAAILFGLLAGANLFFPDAPQYRGLAESMLQGKLYFLSMPEGWGDTALFQGRHYWPLGILPAVVLIPFVLIGIYHQGVLSFFSVLGVFYLCFWLAEKVGYSRNDGCWLALAFCFGTSFLGVAAVPLSWSYAHVVAVLFLFLAINEYEGRRRFAMIGLCLGLAMASRPLTAINSIFFVGGIAFSAAAFNNKAKSLAAFALPMALIVALIAWYNFARFGDLVEPGYSYQISYDGRMFADYASWDNKAGLFSLSNIPDHFMRFAFGLPTGGATGTSVFLASPFLLFLFISALRWETLDYALALNICVLIFITLAFRSSGGTGQLGWRFSLDYLPFVFWLLMRRLRELSAGFKKLIGVAIIIDLGMLVYFASVR